MVHLGYHDLRIWDANSHPICFISSLQTFRVWPGVCCLMKPKKPHPQQDTKSDTVKCLLLEVAVTSVKSDSTFTFDSVSRITPFWDWTTSLIISYTSSKFLLYMKVWIWSKHPSTSPQISCAVLLTETGTILEGIWKSLLDDGGSGLFLLQSAMTTTSSLLCSRLLSGTSRLLCLVPACFPQTAHLLTLHCTTNSISRMSCRLWISSWPTRRADPGQVPKDLYQAPNVRSANRLHFAPKRTSKVYSVLSFFGFCQSLKTKASTTLNCRTQ